MLERGRWTLACVVATLMMGAHGQVVQRFDGKGTPYVPVRLGPGGGPRVVDGAMRLLDGGKDEANAITFGAHMRLARRIESKWRMRIGSGGEGMSFALLSTKEFGETGAPEVKEWEEPKLKGSFAVGFDISDPPTQDIFNAQGNIYDRPQHEVALTWDGMEMVKVVTPVDYRTGKWVDVRVVVEFVPGGAEVTVGLRPEVAVPQHAALIFCPPRLTPGPAGVALLPTWVALRQAQGDETPAISDFRFPTSEARIPTSEALVFTKYFIPTMTPYESRPCFGGRTSELTTTCDIDDVSVRYSGKALPDVPLTVNALDKQITDASHRSQTNMVAFPPDNAEYARIILTLTLGRPAAGYDPWDRCAGIYIYDDKGRRFEIQRYITPYGRGFTWRADVTDYRPLLKGTKKVEAWCETYGPGWLVSVDFSFYRGKPDRLAYKVENLWCGWPEYGDPDDPTMVKFFAPKTLMVDPAANAGAKLRFTVTGHGQSPTTDNAAEFLVRKRTVTVNGTVCQNTLWKTDNYLNPCRPQGGTWKFDRAGWGPGTAVQPWDIDISRLVKPGKPVTISYVAEPYVNKNRSQQHATHWVESQIVYYRKP